MCYPDGSVALWGILCVRFDRRFEVSGQLGLRIVVNRSPCRPLPYMRGPYSIFCKNEMIRSPLLAISRICPNGPFVVVVKISDVQEMNWLGEDPRLLRIAMDKHFHLTSDHDGGVNYVSNESRSRDTNMKPEESRYTAKHNGLPRLKSNTRFRSSRQGDNLSHHSVGCTVQGPYHIDMRRK